MIWLALLNVLVILACLRLARHRALGAYRESVVNPMLVLALLLAVMNVDYWVLAGDPRSVAIFELRVSAYRDAVMDAYAGFTVFSWALVCGVWVGLGRRKHADAVVTEIDRSLSVERASRIALTVVCLAGLAASVGYLGNLKLMLAGEFSRQIYFRENQWVNLVFLLLIPAFSIFAYAKRSFDREALLWLVIVSALLAISGSRGALLLLGTSLVAALAAKGKVVRWWWIVPIVPLVTTILLLYRFYFRASWAYGSVGDFVASYGGVLGVFFKSSEISFAEAFLAVGQYRERIESYPFEGILGAASYLLPREIFSWKPLSASAHFTEYLSPNRWEFTKSEILVTGFGNVLMEFGLYWGALVICGIGFFWGRLVAASARASRFYVAVLYPFVVWWMYVFLRGDFFNLGSTIWPLAIVVAMHVAVRTLPLSRIRIGSF